MASVIYSFLRKKVQEKGNFNLSDVVPLDVVDKIKIPGFFIAGKKDKLVAQHHVYNLYKKYKGSKSLSIVDQGHNSKRPISVINDILKFLKFIFGKNKKLVIATVEEKQISYPKKYKSKKLKSTSKVQRNQVIAAKKKRIAKKKDINSYRIPPKKLNKQMKQQSQQR